MKTKVFLFSACVLGACLTACNEEYLGEQQITSNNVTESGEVIGADLASKGMKVVIEGTNTRAVNNAWENGDRFGMGWFRYGNVAITATQDEAVWENASASTDVNLYANHMFTYNNGGFATTTDVYQGAYFGYWPYEALGSVNAKTIEVNAASQTGDFEYERFNKALHLTAQQFIGAGESTDENGTMTLKLVPASVVNVLGVNATPEQNILNNETLKGLTITSMEVEAKSGSDVFVTKATLKPGNLPKRISTTKDEDLAEMVYEAADQATKSTNKNSFLTNLTKASSITTTVENKDFTLSSNHELRAFALPITESVTYSTDEEPSITVTVGRVNEDGTLKYALGEFDINSTNSETLIGKLKTALSDENDITSWTKVVRIDNEWQSLRKDMVANLTVNDFAALTSNIESVEQWNDLVAIYNALVDIKGAGNVAKPTFTVTSDIVFKEDIKVPACGAVLSTLSATVTIDGDVEWPEALEADGNAVVVVNQGATLTFDPSKAAEINADITNHGTIKAGQFASISTDAADKLDNTDGRVIVEYGAYIYPTATKEGVIAYEVTANNATEMGHINQLIATSAQKGYASVNTLIVKTELNLNAKAGSDTDGDRYEEGTTSGNLSSLEKIDIELNGGKVIYTTGNNNKVNNVISIDGENTIEDVQPMGDITVKGGILNIDTKPFPYSKNLSLIAGKSVNALAGKLNVNTTVYATSVVSKRGSEIVVAENEALYYIGQNFEHEGTTTGKIESTDNSKATTVKESFALLLANSSANTTSAQDFVNGVNGYKGNTYDSLNSYVGFYCVFNAWLESVGEPALIDGETYNDLTVDHLTLFETLTGYTFDWNN